MSEIALFSLAEKLQKSGHFSYNAGDILDPKRFVAGDLLFDILDPKRFVAPTHHHEHLLRQVIQQPTALYCGTVKTVAEVLSVDTFCCFAHIVKRPEGQWVEACNRLNEHLHNKLKSAIERLDLSVDKVLVYIEAEGNRNEPTAEWRDAFEWLKVALPYVCTPSSGIPPAKHQDVADTVKAAADTFRVWNGIDDNGNEKPLRPCQLAAILLNVYGVKSGTKLLIEMKTGEGKTFVCGVTASVVAKLFPSGPAVILTSSLDRATADMLSTKTLIEAILGAENGPITVEGDLKPGVNNGAGRVAYGQVSDVQRIVVDMLTQSNPKGLYSFLSTCSFFLDEADHVLVEQAESLLFIASPCPSYYAMHALFFHVQYRLDFGGEYTCNMMPSRNAVIQKEKANKLAKELVKFFFDIENNKTKAVQAPLFPTIIHLDVFVAATASGAMSARFKRNGKEYVIEATSESDHSGTIAGVPRVTIMDIATGSESDGTRWTTEAPNLEAMEGLPIGGSDPLAFYCAFPYVLQKCKWFGGITGTVGAAHTVDYYGKTFDIWSTFRIPRNKPTTIYRQPTLVAATESEQVQNICESIENWIVQNVNLPAKGPILVITESIRKAQEIEEALRKRGHPLMQAIVKAKPAVDSGATAPAASPEVKWKFKTPIDAVSAASPTSLGGAFSVDAPATTTSASIFSQPADYSHYVAHVFPFYRREHCVMEEFPDWVVIVASNKGGRGLDLKLDHQHCPEHVDGSVCNHLHHIGHATAMKSVLFVILTDVLPGRQDEQAIGRCGRSGKAGVVQYHLAMKEDDTHPTDAEITYLQRKINKDSFEAGDLSAKTNRIGQHRFDGFVLDTFCANLPTFVGEWMFKLFPKSKNRKSAPATSITSSTSGDAAATSAAFSNSLNDDDSLRALEPIVLQWFSEFVTQAWAYWRGYGGDRRQSGDFRYHFETTMGLAAAVDLPESKEENALQRFAERFWRFACILRFSGEALYTFAKSLLAGKHDLQVIGLCCDILNQASSPTFEMGGNSLTLPPQDYPWQPEISGNAALLFARLSSTPAVGLQRAIDATDIAIVRYSCDEEMSAVENYPSKVPTSDRKSETHYLTQRKEIVAQLKARRDSLNTLLAQQPQIRVDLKHISKALEDSNTAFHAYCLGYGFCEVMFEWFVVVNSVDSPFQKPEQKTSDWGAILTKQAKELGATPKYTQVGGTGAGGNAEVKTEAQRNKLAKEGADIMARLDSQTEKQVDANVDKNTAAPSYQWKTSVPTVSDIKASKQSVWQAIVGWLSFVWAWLVTMLTAPVRKYSAPHQKVGAESAQQVVEDAIKSSPIWQHLHAEMNKQRAQQIAVTGGLVAGYIGADAKAVVDCVDNLGTFLRQSDLVKEQANIRTDGTTANDVSYGEAKSQAKSAAADQVHLRDDSLSKEEMYIVGKTLEAIKKLAAEQKLEGFDDQMLKLLEAISQYNEFAQEGKVDAATAKLMNETMKKLWQNTLQFALTHGAKIDNLTIPLANYNIAKTQSAITETAEQVVKVVTDTVKTVVRVVQKVVKWVWGWFKGLWVKVKEAVNKVVEVIKEIPVVGKVVESFTKSVVNPVYQAAKEFFDSAKETLTSVVSGLVSAVSSAFNAIAEAINIAVKAIGEMASKAWNWLSKNMADVWAWLKETDFWKSFCEGWVGTAVTWLWTNVSNFWKSFSEGLVSAFNVLAEKIIWLFDNIVMPVSAWVGTAVTWLWTNVLKPVLAVIAPSLLISMQELGKFFDGLLSYLRYWWQGAGEIMQDFIWGTEFDIIDVKGNPSRYSRFRMQMRGALSRVWASSRLQWWLDASIRLGLDLDPREHVRNQQQRVHDGFQRRERLATQKNGMVFAVLGVVLSALAVVATILTGGALLPSSIAFVCATLSALLQYASMDLEADRTVDEERKKQIQILISIAQSVILIGSILTGYFCGGLAEAEIIALSAMRYIGIYLKKIADWLKLISGTLRTEERVKGSMRVLDKFLKMIGLGASVILLDIHKSLAGMASTLLESVGSVLQHKKKLRNTIEQNQQQEQNQRETDDEDDDTKGDKDNLVTLLERQITRVLTRKDMLGWTLSQTISIVGASANNKSGASDRGHQSQGVPTYFLTPPGGGEPITVTFVENSETKQIEAVFSRPLSAEEKALFGFVGDAAPSVEQVGKMFQNDGSSNVASDTTVDVKNLTYFNKDGVEIKRVQSVTKEDGTVSATFVKDKLRLLMVQPNGDPKPSPLFLDFRSGNMSSKICGDVTEEHLTLLAEFTGSDTSAVADVIQNDLSVLSALAKKNQEDKRTKTATQNEQTRESPTPAQQATRDAANAVGKWAFQAVMSFVMPVWNWLVGSLVVRTLRFVWRNWIEKTKLGSWIKMCVTSAHNAVQTLAKQSVSVAKIGVPTSVANWLGWNMAEPEAPSPQEMPAAEVNETVDVVDENAEAVKRLFQALLSPEPTANTATESSDGERQQPTLEEKLVSGLVSKFELHNVNRADAGFELAMEQLLAKFHGEKDRKLTAQEKAALQKQIDEHGTAKTLFDWLSKIALDKLANQAVPTFSPGDDYLFYPGSAPMNKSKGAAMYDQFVTSGAGYSRRTMRFLDPPRFNPEQTAVVIKQLAYPEKEGVLLENIQQNKTAKQIQADLEKFVRAGDQQGLVQYVQNFCNQPMPEEFKDVPGMEQKWQAAKIAENQLITEQLCLLTEQAWGQISDDRVAKTTHDLVEMFSQSLSNVWIESTAESVIEKAIAADSAVYLNWSSKGESESAYEVVEKDGKIRLVVNRGQMGQLHERHVEMILQRRKFEIWNSKLKSNHGIDILAVKFVEVNGIREVESIWVVECKATGQADKNHPDFGKTKHGKQLESTWIAKKIADMYKQGGEDLIKKPENIKLRESAILMRKNLEKIRPVVAFKKDGLNSWGHQDRVPEFNPEDVEELLKEAKWEQNWDK